MKRVTVFGWTLIAAAALFFITNSYGYKILLIGDSTVITSYLSGVNTITYKLLAKLQAAQPDVTWTVANAGLDGESIGPGTSKNLIEASGTSRYNSVVAAHPGMNMVLVRYGINDGKYYSPANFIIKARNLISKLKTDYPGAKIILETSMFVDFPNHAKPYYGNYSAGFTQGQSRNVYMKPYYDSLRTLAAAANYPLVDVCARLDSLTQKGDWDLRIRGDAVTLDSSLDAQHIADADKSWWDNIHPNPHGCDAIAQAESEIILTAYAASVVEKKEGPLQGANLDLQATPLSNGQVRFSVLQKATSGFTLSVADVKGRVLWNYNAAPAGTSTAVSWNPSGTGSGIYFAHLRSRQGDVARRFALIF